MRKALCVGIDSYEKINNLYGCVNDASLVKKALERNGDGSLNFNVRIRTAISEKSYITRAILKDEIESLFKSEVEVAVLYYSGHGAIDEAGGYLCTS